MHIGALVFLLVLFAVFGEAGMALLGIFGIVMLAGGIFLVFYLMCGTPFLWFLGSIAAIIGLLWWIGQLPPSPHSLSYRAGAQVRRLWLWATTWDHGK